MLAALFVVFATVLAFLFTATLVGAVRAWALTYIWAWFVPGVWSSAPTLGFWQAWGLLILLGFVFYRNREVEDKKTKDKEFDEVLTNGLKAIGTQVLFTFVTLGIAWVIHKVSP